MEEMPHHFWAYPIGILIIYIEPKKYWLIDLFVALCPSQQFSSHVGTVSYLPGLNQYNADVKVPCSMTRTVTPWAVCFKLALLFNPKPNARY